MTSKINVLVELLDDDFGSVHGVELADGQMRIVNGFQLFTNRDEAAWQEGYRLPEDDDSLFAHVLAPVAMIRRVLLDEGDGGEWIRAWDGSAWPRVEPWTDDAVRRLCWQGERILNA